MSTKPTSAPQDTTTFDVWLDRRRVDPVAVAKRIAELDDKETLTDEDVGLLRSEINSAAKSDNVDRAIITGHQLWLLQKHGKLETRADYGGLWCKYRHARKLIDSRHLSAYGPAHRTETTEVRNGLLRPCRL
jgi:hypothetical protein